MNLRKLQFAGMLTAGLLLASGTPVFAGQSQDASASHAEAAAKAELAKARLKRRNAASPGRGNGIAVPKISTIPDYTNDGITMHRNALGQTVYSISPVHADVSRPLSELDAKYHAANPQELVEQENEPPENPRLPSWLGTHSRIPDPVVQGDLSDLSNGGITPAAPATGFNFIGVGQSGGIPPDTNGSVGYTHYVQTVNTRYQVWTLNRATNTPTSVLGPTNISALWSGFGGACQTQNSGDPIVLFDKQATNGAGNPGRWMISQFTTTADASGNYLQCVAVSTTESATGTYVRWAFILPKDPATNLPIFGDYPHFGVWSDAYYMMAHGFSDSSATGTYVAGLFAAMDRPKMLAGNLAATWQVIQDVSEGGQMPADVDGFAPPPTGAPGIFLSVHTNGMFIYRMKVDFVTPANTVRTLQAKVPVAASIGACDLAATAGTCIPQPGSGQLLDSLGDRLMFRVAYRNFVDHESMVVTHSVDPSVAGVVSGIRWYDFRLSGTPNATCASFPCLYQQSTFIGAPADTRSRWMGSAAFDTAENLIVGYSTTGTAAATDAHSIRYASRAKGDAPGTLNTETIIQTAIHNQVGASRWGDYSSMSVDPVDDCALFYTQEYVAAGNAASSTWGTKIASAKFPAGSGAGQCPASTCIARPAAAPTIGTATVPGLNQISVNWSAVAPVPGSYAIERAVGACGSEGLYGPLAFVPGATTNFTDSTVQGGLTYSYRVIAATDAAGKCQAFVASGCVSATATGTCNLKPVYAGASSGTSNSAATCGVNVNWAAATSSCPLTPAVRYNLFRGTVPDFVPAVGNRIATCVSGNSYLDAVGRSSGITYFYVARAEDTTTSNGGECNGGNEENNSIVIPGTAYGNGAPSAGTWTDGGGDGTAFMLFNVMTAGDTDEQSWRFITKVNDAAGPHAGNYAYRNVGPAATDIYTPNTCTEMQTPTLTASGTTLNLNYWEKHQLEKGWDGVVVEFSKNGGAWTTAPAPSNSTGVGCLAGDATADWASFACTVPAGSPGPINGCGYAAAQAAFTGPVGSGTSCTNWVTATTPSAYAHRCHQITGLAAGNTVQFRWRFSSDPGLDFAGMYLDDIAITNIQLPAACSTCVAGPIPTLGNVTLGKSGANISHAWSAAAGATGYYTYSAATPNPVTWTVQNTTTSSPGWNDPYDLSSPVSKFFTTTAYNCNGESAK